VRYNKRKRNGFYWTIEYIDRNGEYYYIGHAATLVELIQWSQINLDKLPFEKGKYVLTR